GGSGAVGEQRHDEADAGGRSLEVVERGELAFGDGGTARLALPTADGVGLAADATGDHGMDRRDGAAAIHALGVWAGDAFGTEAFLCAARAAEGLPGNDLDEI